MPEIGVSNIIHYLDDFFIIGSPHTSKCINNVATLHTYMTGNLNPFPVVECNLSLFVASLHSESLSSNTAKTYLARIWYTQIMMGPSNPRIADMQQLQYTIGGFHKVYRGESTSMLSNNPSNPRKNSRSFGLRVCSTTPPCYGQHHTCAYLASFELQRSWFHLTRGTTPQFNLGMPMSR